MRSLPLHLVEFIYRLPFVERPRFLASEAPGCPSREELRSGMVLIEVRGGYLKWAHLLCPKCGDHIQLPLVGPDKWSVRVDFFRRPTFAPSIWERATCGAHFFVKKGSPQWCAEAQ